MSTWILVSPVFWSALPQTICGQQQSSVSAYLCCIHSFTAASGGRCVEGYSQHELPA